MKNATPNASVWAERAAHLLTTPAALVELSLAEARRVVAYMQPGVIAAGTTFMREGDETDNDHLLLVIEGEVQIKSHDPAGQGDGVVVRVLGQGSLIGELGLLDGQPRSADCIALTHLQVARLNRADFMRLLEDEPRLGNRLLLLVANRTANLLREITTKFKVFVRMNKVMSAELQANVDQVAARYAPTPLFDPLGARRAAGKPDSGYSVDWPEVT